MRPLGHFTRVLLRVLQPSIEPVPATDGLIHLAHSGSGEKRAKTAGRHPRGRGRRPAGDPEGRWAVYVPLSRGGKIVVHAFASCPTKRKRNRTLRRSCATPSG